MPKSSKYKEHRTYKKIHNLKYSKYITDLLHDHMDHFPEVYEVEKTIIYQDKLEHLRGLWWQWREKKQKRRQKVLKIRQKSLQKRHFTP